MSLKMNSAPYQRSRRTTLQIMVELTIALLLVWVAAVVFYFTKSAELGLRAILLMVVAIFTTALIDAGVALIKHKKGQNLLNEILDSVIHNYSFVTAIIFTLCCPVYVTYYVIIIGCLFSTGIKHCFGGFGKNIFNPAIIARIATGLAFVDAFSIPKESIKLLGSATVTAQYSGLDTAAKWLSDALPKKFDLTTLLVGDYVGAMGETFTILILVLGIVLAIRGVINWRTSAFYLGTVALTALVIGFFIEGLNPLTYVVYHLALGGLMFGAVFMITDPVTSPTSPFGKALIGVIAGLLTVLIRVAGGLPEGVMYTIAIINMISPAIDKFVVGRTTDGHGKKWGVIAGVLVASIAVNTALSVSSVKAFEESKNSSTPEVVLSREEKLFGIEGATYEKVTLGTKPAETKIVDTYLITEKNIPVAFGYELTNSFEIDASGHAMGANATIGVSISLLDDKVTVRALDDSAGTAKNYSDKGLAGVNKVIENKTASEIANVTIPTFAEAEGTDFKSTATYSTIGVMELVKEACTQYATVDKFFNAFGVETTFTSFETEGTKIQSAYTYTLEDKNYIAYFVYDETGVSIDDAHETIYPVVAVSINLDEEKVAAAKVITNATSHAWAKSYYEKINTFIGSLVGQDVNELSTKSKNDHKSYDTVASATYSSEGIFDFVVTACKQYVSVDKAVLEGGNA